MLKYEGMFKKGDLIRAHGFEPREGSPSMYLEGCVFEEDHINEMGTLVVTIKVTKDTEFGGQAVDAFWDIALETMFDFDDRVMKVA